MPFTKKLKAIRAMPEAIADMLKDGTHDFVTRNGIPADATFEYAIQETSGWKKWNENLNDYFYVSILFVFSHPSFVEIPEGGNIPIVSPIIEKSESYKYAAH